MAKILDITPEHRTSLYDSDTLMSCVTEKVVDITEDCPEASADERAVLLFTRAKRGRIVEIVRPYKGEEFVGSMRIFFVDELDNEMCAQPRDDTFGLTADQLGLSKPALCEMIRALAPA